MAASAMAYSSSETERDNFSRFAQGILGPGTTIARDVLQHYITPNVLSRKVKNGQSIWYRLNKEQKALVTNASSSRYREFDITLIYYLLRNLVSNINDPSKPNFPIPTKGWGRPPQPGDVSISDDVERLRLLRNNVLAHVSSASLPESSYQKVWQQLKEIANRMGRYLHKNYLRELEDLESYKMTEAQWKDLFSAIKSIKDNFENMTKDLRDMHMAMSEAHETTNQLKRLSSNMSNQEMNCSESEIENLRRKLLRINECETQTIPVSPLQKSMTLPIDLLYVSVVVRENFEYHHRRRKRKLEPGRIDVPKETKKTVSPSLDESDSESEDSSESEESTSDSLCTCTEEEESEDSGPDISDDSDSSNTSTSSSEDEAELPSKTTQRVNYFADQKDDQHHLNERHHKIINGPEEIFLKDGTPVRYAFMLGRAAHGKTVYCLRLLQHWCNAKSNGTTIYLSDWEEVMKSFHFLFFVPLRHVQKSRASVNEMITQDIFKHDKECENAIKHVLSSEKFRCLIIIDGLDEWNPNKDVINQLTCKAIPNFEDMSNCTIFITSRPWKFHEVADIVRDTDRVIEILGLNDNQLKKVVSNVLTNFYGVTEGHDDYKAVYKEILEKSREEKLKSFMRIPLLAIAFVQISYEKKTIRESLTSFYIALIDLIIKRALGKDQIPECFQKQNAEDINVDSFLHHMIEPTENIAKFFSILLSLGKVAFDSLKPKAGRLVFTKEDLVQTVGEKELLFALHSGLLTRTEAPGSFNEENVKISFFHKTIQEFLAAFYLAHNEGKLSTFLDNLSNLQSIVDISYVIIFVSGLAPCLAGTMSEYLPGIVEQDKNVCRWIHKPTRSHWNKVKTFFEFQLHCFKEINYSFSLRRHNPTPHWTAFCFSIVYLDVNSNKELTNIIAGALKGPSIDIAHLCLKGVQNDNRCGINDIVLKNFLGQSTSLKSLTIVGDHKDRTVHKLIVPTLESLELSSVKIHNSTTEDELEDPLLAFDMPRIRRIKLCGIKFADRPLGLSFKMENLESIQFSKVDMSEKNWKRFFYSLSTFQHQYNVTLQDCNIDADIHQYISSLQGFTMEIRMDEQSSETVIDITGTGRNRHLSSGPAATILYDRLS